MCKVVKCSIAVVLSMAFFSFSFGQTKKFSSSAKFFPILKDFQNNNPLSSIDTALITSKKDTALYLDNFLWGIVDSNNLFRVYKNTIYKVEDTSGLVIYSIDSYKSDFNFYSFVFPEIPFVEYQVKSKEYFVSKNLSSNVLSLTINNLQTIVSNPTFIKKAKRKFRWYNYDIYERYKSGQFMVNSLYNKYVVE